MIKKKSWIMNLIFFLFLCIIPGHTARNFEARDETALSKEREIIKLRYESVRRSLGVSKPASRILIRTEKDRDIRGNLIQIDDGSIELQLVEQTGEIAFVMAFDAIGEHNKWRQEISQINKPVQPTRTETEIVRMARDSVEKITGESLPENYTVETIFYDRGPCKGEWSIRWHRTLNGYPYDNDIIGISLSDISGKFESLVITPTSEICPTEVKILKETAQKIALQLTERSVSGLYRKVYGRPTNPECESTELRIVNPNGLFRQYSKYRPPSVSFNPKSRLAYYIWIKYKVDPPKNKIRILVWVDAATGEILGGDYVM